MKRYKNWIILLTLFVLILVGYLVSKKWKKNDEKAENTNSTQTTSIIDEENNTIRNININETISIDRNIKNIKNAKCDSINIDQREEEMRVSIYIRNMSKTEKVEAKTLKINLLNKSNKVIYSQDVQMEEIEAYGFTNIDLELTIQEPVLVYDVDIIANE